MAGAKTEQISLPREVANKSDKENLLRAIRMALEIEGPAIRSNTQTFNSHRYAATSSLPDYENLKDRARRYKQNAIARLPELLHTLELAIDKRGGFVHLAPTAEDACNYIRGICQKHSATLVVKGKSITSEEIRLNHVLEAAGIEVAESDLAEFILQVADEQPSHIIAPALHYSRERITALFKSKFRTDLPLDTGEELTRFARERLRDKFLRADVGITGANLIAADTGTLMLVESEGNIRMSAFLPPVHIAIAGVEKIIPDRWKMGPFLELLPASATGQVMTSYVSLLSPPLDDPPFAMPGKPRKQREFHLVLIDNGRMRMRQDPVLKEALRCIRCSACLNSCANFQAVGGHAFGGETYSGGIGGAWEAGTGKLENARFSELCTGCSRCVNACPVQIDIPWLNENLRERLNATSEPSEVSGLLALLGGVPEKDRSSPAAKIFFGNYHFFAKWGSRLPTFSNAISRSKFARSMMKRYFEVDPRRSLPPFPAKTFEQAAREVPRANPKTSVAKVAFFADVFTNYGLPERGLVAVKLLRALDVEVVVTESLPEGRAALSQGMISTAAKHFARAAEMLDAFAKEGLDILILEPTSLAMFRRDRAHFMKGGEKYRHIRLLRQTFEPVDYISRLLEKTGREASDIFDAARSPVGSRLFFHSHCQQRTIGAAEPTLKLLREIGFDVAISSVECCGMAGSFGYKQDFYELSMAVAADLFQQVAAAEKDGARALVASATSCTEQLRGGLHRDVLHPAEILLACLTR
jgi:iron-sulfur cluster protein